MPRQSKGARLWLDPERKENGKLRKRATWVIRDGARKISTGCAEESARRLNAHSPNTSPQIPAIAAARP